MSVSAPYLSFVVTARNDNHGGNLLRRMQLFVNGLVEQCRRFDLAAELILVEWNPLPSQPLLAEVLRWPIEGSPCAIRILEVPPALHGRYRYAQALPVYQMIAKNVGIRRARGEFVLATNIDILFSDELVRFLAARELRPDRTYRIDRHDVPAEVPTDVSIQEQLAYCQANVIRWHTTRGTLVSTDCVQPSGWFARVFGGSGFIASVCNDLIAEWKKSGNRKRARGLLLFPYLFPRYLYHRLASRLGSCLGCATVGYPLLHTNASGDFTLLARDVWFRLRGYAELDIFSMHLDGLLVHAAHHLGAAEHVLNSPMRIYHVEHGVGSGWTPEGEAKLNARLASAGIPQVTFQQFETWARQMQRERKPLTFSDESWGLANESLKETVIHPGTLQPSLT